MAPMRKPQTESAHAAAFHRDAIGRKAAPQDSCRRISVALSSTAGLSDEEIVCALRSAEDRKLADDLFAELFRRYEALVRSWCRRLTSDHNHAVDLVQEIFLKVHRNVHCYRGDSKFSTWLYVIARNHCYNSRKKKAAEPVECASLISALHRDCNAPDPDTAIERSQSARLIQNLFSSALNPLEARIMSMHYGREMPLLAITQELALSNPSGAKAYIVTARRKLNKALRHQKSNAA
jgi:RNA polymerase sigma-70 factor (ECF subfamily)